MLIAYGNLRGVKESGKIFAVPTYFFIVNMVMLLGVGVVRIVTSVAAAGADVDRRRAWCELGHSTATGCCMGAALFVVLKAFGSGGAAVTGVEAISNGVPAFKGRRGRTPASTLVIMGSLLGVMFLGLSMLAATMHAMPYEEGTPTVISQVGKFVYGETRRRPRPLLLRCRRARC